MVAFDNSVSPPASTTTRYYGACPERSRENDQRIVLRTSVDSGGVESDSRTFVFGNYIDEVLIMRLSSGSDFYYAHDHLYSPTVLYGNTGNIVLRYEYDAYGKRDQYTAAWVPSSIQIFGNPFAFTGRELDYLDGGSLNLMHYRARTYDPETGRFMQRDPLGIDPAGGLSNSYAFHKQYEDGKYGYVNSNSFKTVIQYKDGMNIYEYVKSNALINLDPYGLSWSPPWSPYPGSGYYPGYEGHFSIKSDGCCWWEKLLCQWEERSYKPRYYTYWAAIGWVLPGEKNGYLSWRIEEWGHWECKFRGKVCKDKTTHDDWVFLGLLEIDVPWDVNPLNWIIMTRKPGEPNDQRLRGPFI